MNGFSGYLTSCANLKMSVVTSRSLFKQVYNNIANLLIDSIFSNLSESGKSYEVFGLHNILKFTNASIFQFSN